MDVKLGKVERLVQDLQTDRKAQYGALGQQLQSLTATTSSLQKALADNRARGQWGERMAEDMLNFMGLVEGVNYIKQSAIEAGTRPDFTFLFPNQKSLNMDAKFRWTIICVISKLKTMPKSKNSVRSSCATSTSA